MKTILVIDDCSDSRDIISSILVDADYDVWVASCPDEAFQLLKREQFDLIICDLHMPFTVGKGFFEFEYSSRVGIKAIQELTEVYPEKPIIAVTATPPSELKQMVEQINYIPTLPKPFSPKQLTEMVTRSFSKERREAVH